MFLPPTIVITSKIDLAPKVKKKLITSPHLRGVTKIIGVATYECRIVQPKPLIKMSEIKKARVLLMIKKYLYLPCVKYFFHPFLCESSSKNSSGCN